MRENTSITGWNKWIYWVFVLGLFLLVNPVNAQFVDPYYQQYYDSYANQQQAYQEYYRGNPAGANLQDDQRDAEMILREQNRRARERVPQQQYNQAQDPRMTYDNYYGHRIHDEAQVQQVMAEARQIASFVRSKTNTKPFLIVDKRNFQFYLFDTQGRLLRIGPIAIGKGKTHVGAFETPVGVFPIKQKIPVDDWIRPDWYFVEEGEPIPKRWEDRRVPGFFRYKMVYDGSRYIHYAEATGGRLTHGCLGLDWQDAEAVFHTMQVGSHCIIIDDSLVTRLAKGEYPVQKPAVAKKPDENTPGAMTAKAETDRRAEKPDVTPGNEEDKVFRSLW